MLPDDLPEDIVITHDMFNHICAESFNRVQQPLDEVMMRALLVGSLLLSFRHTTHIDFWKRDSNSSRLAAQLLRKSWQEVAWGRIRTNAALCR